MIGNEIYIIVNHFFKGGGWGCKVGGGVRWEKKMQGENSLEPTSKLDRAKERRQDEG